MKPTELRLGNYVYPFDDIELCSNEEIFKNCIEVDGGVIISTSTYYPIPLTEEWLLKFGFVKIGTYRIEFVKYSKYKDFEIEVSLYINDGKIVTGQDFEINYVHQLQNLYFALTGEELEIK